MTFKLSERHRNEYYQRGYTVFEGVIPPSLISDLRRTAEVLQSHAFLHEGVTKARPATVVDRMDVKSFRDLRELGSLRDALSDLLSPKHGLTALEDNILEVFYQPAEHARCLYWHRDLWETSMGMTPQDFRPRNESCQFFVKSNLPLYADPALWYVPGTHLRLDTPEQLSTVAKIPVLKGRSIEECEAMNLEYVRAMPGATQVFVGVGDFAVYSPTAWHIGSYSPSVRRATLHDSIWTPEARDWFFSVLMKRQAGRDVDSGERHVTQQR